MSLNTFTRINCVLALRAVALVETFQKSVEVGVAMVKSPSNRLQSYWPPNRPPVEQPLHEPVITTSSDPTWAEWLGTCMGERPIATLATATAIGLLLGWLVKRR